MTYYLAAYVVFWAALFGYLLGLVERQARLNRRAADLVERLPARSAEVGAENPRGPRARETGP